MRGREEQNESSSANLLKRNKENNDSNTASSLGDGLFSTSGNNCPFTSDAGVNYFYVSHFHVPSLSFFDIDALN